jgi:hypothetical protein
MFLFSTAQKFSKNSGLVTRVLFLGTGIQLVLTFTPQTFSELFCDGGLCQDVFHLDMTACQKKLFSFIGCENLGSYHKI